MNTKCEAMVNACWFYDKRELSMLSNILTTEAKLPQSYENKKCPIPNYNLRNLYALTTK